MTWTDEPGHPGVEQDVADREDHGRRRGQIESTSASGANRSRSSIRWCLCPGVRAEAAAVPPAVSTAAALTGIPPFRHDDGEVHQQPDRHDRSLRGSTGWP